jgi:hypothetical protein
MRILITDEATDLSKLAANVSRSARPARATLERISALNPQLADLSRIAAGTAVILPESADLKPGAGSPVGAELIADLGERLHAGLREMARRGTRHGEQLAADHGAVRDALKTAAAKRLIDGDPVLKKQLAAAESHFKAQQKRAEQSREQVAEATKLAEAEFAKLPKLLG